MWTPTASQALPCGSVATIYPLVTYVGIYAYDTSFNFMSNRERSRSRALIGSGLEVIGSGLEAGGHATPHVRQRASSTRRRRYHTVPDVTASRPPRPAGRHRPAGQHHPATGGSTICRRSRRRRCASKASTLIGLREPVVQRTSAIILTAKRSLGWSRARRAARRPTDQHKAPR